MPARAAATGDKRDSRRLVGGHWGGRHGLRVESDAHEHKARSRQGRNNFHHLVLPTEPQGIFGSGLFTMREIARQPERPTASVE
jgi:hypothetical protein